MSYVLDSKGRAKAFSYSKITKELIGVTWCDRNPLNKSEFMLPLNATFVHTDLKPSKNEAITFDGIHWRAEPDFRGVKYRDINGNEVIITKIGELIPEDYLLNTEDVKPVELTNEDAMREREYAYAIESDKLFIESERKKRLGDIEGAEVAEKKWLEKVRDIQKRYPI
jgi:hypothetical protein